jgi:SAM-dependent methyltransferase
MTRPTECWCGAQSFQDFSPNYLECAACRTLLSKSGLRQEEIPVGKDEQAYYGRKYWLSGMAAEDKGFPDIITRARTELVERNLYWLNALLSYRPSGGRLLEVGCSHGGFLALARCAEFDPTGIELSPWICKFAQKTFGVSVLCGPVEELDLPKSKFDIVALLDVLEHFPDPKKSMAACARTLTQDGVFLIQTPCYDPQFTHRDLAEAGHPFLRMLLPREHVYLFSRNSVSELLGRLGFPHVRFLPAIFSNYDMFLLASRIEIPAPDFKQAEQRLSGSPAGRMVLALLDMDAERTTLGKRLTQAETDSDARLKDVQTLHKLLAESKADRAARGEQIESLTEMLRESEADRADRGKQIDTLTTMLQESEADRVERSRQVETLNRLLQEERSAMESFQSAVREIFASALVRFVAEIAGRDLLARVKKFLN